MEAAAAETETAAEMDLPRECWELIFSFLDPHRHHEPLSLSCKLFLSITNSLRSSLSLFLSSAPSILSRFPNLRSLDLSFLPASPDPFLHLLPTSCPHLRRLDLSNHRSLPLHSLPQFPNLQTLLLSKLGSLDDRDLFAIPRLFPNLHELDISYPQRLLSLGVSDQGVSFLSRNLTGLRRINLSGNHFLSDHSLEHLSNHCPLLSHVALKDCTFITPKGIDYLISNSPDVITRLSLRVGFSPGHDIWCRALSNARALSCLDVSHSVLWEGLLSSLARVNLPLKAINLSYSTGFTFDGITSLLSNTRSIESLDLEGVNFLTDFHMSQLCKFLGKLTSINLSFCPKVGNSTFYELVMSCPLLEEIRMTRTRLGNARFREPDMDTEFINSKVRSLHLARNYYLHDEWCIRVLMRVCPNMHFLDLSYCSAITGEGISTILKNCPELTNVDISDCKSISGLVFGSDLPRLEILRVSGIGLHNQELATIGRRCYSLMVLDLQRCLNLTDEGVKEAVSHCKALREINLRCCNGVSVHIVPWLVFSRRSLRKITLPHGVRISEQQRYFYRCHGCIVNDG